MRGISKRYMIFGLLLLVIASAGCTGGSPSQEATVQESPATQATTSAPVTTAAPTTAPEPSENAERPSGAVQAVASSLGTNQLGITLEDLVSLENPKGEGTFVYVRQTEFAGVERYIIWLVLNDIAYPLNGATKDVTPSLPWPREAQADEWKKTGLSPYSATEAIEIVY